MPVGTGSINRASRTSKKSGKEQEVKATPAKRKTVTAQKKPEVTVYAEETVLTVGNECCHLTEELPVHLL